MVCFFLFYQTLAAQLYRDKRLLKMKCIFYRGKQKQRGEAGRGNTEPEKTSWVGWGLGMFSRILRNTRSDFFFESGSNHAAGESCTSFQFPKSSTSKSTFPDKTPEPRELGIPHIQPQWRWSGWSAASSLVYHPPADSLILLCLEKLMERGNREHCLHGGGREEYILNWKFSSNNYQSHYFPSPPCHIKWQLLK